MTSTQSLAALLCHKQHAPEWSAPYPRTHPCHDCFELAGEIHKAGWGKS